MDKSNYTINARVKPTIISLYFPITLAIGFLSSQNSIVKSWNVIYPIIASLLSSTVVTAAFGFFCWQSCREFSKLLFQIPLFKEDETHMPTTDYLLWSNRTYPDAEKILVHKKIYDLYQIRLYSKQMEKKDELSARKLIASAVRIIREDTRDNEILLRYNIDFGFWRNLLGGCSLGLLIVIGVCMLNLLMPTIPWRLLGIGAILELGLFLFGLCFLRQAGKFYARQLISVFRAKKV